MRNILIIGKSGLIGQRISQILSDNYHNYIIYSGTRQVSGDTCQFQLDVTKKETLSQLIDANISLIVLCTTDKANNVLKFCIENSIDYLDVTKPTADLREAYKIAHESRAMINSRIVFASGWMGGIIGGLIPQNINIEHLKLYIYYSLKDIGGKSSADFLAENVTQPFSFYMGNRPTQVRYFSEPESYQFNFGIGAKKVYNFDTPDIYVLNKFRKIPSISAKIAYSSSLAIFFIRVCLSLGIFSVLPIDTRKNIFRSAGKGDITSFDISYFTSEKEEKKLSVECIKGQAELTSFAMVLNIEKLFTKEKGIYFAHDLYCNTELRNLLQQNEYINIK